MMQHLAMVAAATLVAVAGAAVEGAFAVEGATTPSTIACDAESNPADGTMLKTSSGTPG